MQLRELQSQFSAEILSGENTGVQTLVEQRGFQATQRINVYRNNIFATLTETLSSIFPVSCAMVGEDFFKSMAQIYIRSHTPDSGNVHDFGEHLPSFIESMPELGNYPYLSALAEIDWACHRAFHSASATSLDISSLGDFSPDNYEDLQFEFHPAIHTIKSKFPIFDIWDFATSNGHADTIPDINSAGQQVLIHRPKSGVKVVNIEDDLFQMINSLREHETLGATITSILDLNPEYNLKEGLNHLFSFGAVSTITVKRRFVHQ